MMEKPDYRKSQGAKTPTEVQRMQRVPYASAIGSIMYAVRCTRPDAAFAQNLCSRFQQNPGEIHWTAIKTILKYLRNTKDMVLVYGEKLKMEFEYIDGLGGVMPSNKRPIEMLCDNETVLAIASDPGILKGAIHFQRKYHYIREVIQEGEIVLKKVHTDDNVVDSFTKPMPFNKHFEHATAIEIVPASSLMEMITSQLQGKLWLYDEVLSNLQAQITGEEKIKAAFEEFKKYEYDRVEQRCAEMDARLDKLSVDFNEELYPHMLTAIAGHRWVIGHGLRLTVMKCGETPKLRQAFANVVSAGIVKGMSEGMEHGIEHGKAGRDLEAMEAYDPKAHS
ncbi:hypothetical protein Tco_0400876 [Tanacetum coccineum]